MSFNLNTATINQLLQIDGIGTVSANKIISNMPHNNFAAVKRQNKGIGPNIITKLKKHAYIEAPYKFEDHNKSKKKSKDCENPITKISTTKIPSTLRYLVYKTYASDTYIVAKCYCCKKNDISMDNFDCGHVKSRKNGGDISLENLRPICGQCNNSMGSVNMMTFIETYKLWVNNDHVHTTNISSTKHKKEKKYVVEKNIKGEHIAKRIEMNENDKDESKKDDSEKNENDKDKSKKDDSEKNESDKDESKKDDYEKNESEKNENEKNESEKNDSEKNKSDKDKSEKDDSEKDDSERDDSEIDNSEKDDNVKDDSEKDDSEKDNSEKNKSEKNNNEANDNKKDDSETNENKKNDSEKNKSNKDNNKNNKSEKDVKNEKYERNQDERDKDKRDDKKNVTCKITKFNSAQCLIVCNNMLKFIDEFQNKHLDYFLTERTYDIGYYLRRGETYNICIYDYDLTLFSREECGYIYSKISDINALCYNNIYKNKLFSNVTTLHIRPIEIKYILVCYKREKYYKSEKYYWYKLIISIHICNDRYMCTNYIDNLLEKKYDTYETMTYYSFFKDFYKKWLEKVESYADSNYVNNSHQIDIELTDNNILNKKIINDFDKLVIDIAKINQSSNNLSIIVSFGIKLIRTIQEKKTLLYSNTFSIYRDAHTI